VAMTVASLHDSKSHTAHEDEQFQSNLSLWCHGFGLWRRANLWS
jgi:hypothetical protein